MNPNRRTALPWLTMLILVLAGCLPAPTPTAPPTQIPPPPTNTATPPPATATAGPTSSPRLATATPTPPPAAGQDDVPMIEIPAGEFIMGLTLAQVADVNGRWFADIEDRRYGDIELTLARSSPQLTVDLPTFPSINWR